jgi:hypothetical protein
VQAGRRQADDEADRLVLVGQSPHWKYSSNVIWPGRKFSSAAPMPSGAAVVAGMPSRAQAANVAGGRRRRRNRGVDVQVDAVQEFVEIALVDTLLKDLDVDFRIDVRAMRARTSALGWPESTSWRRPGG